MNKGSLIEEVYKKHKMLKMKNTLLTFLLIIPSIIYAQDEEELEKEPLKKDKKGFYSGIYVGSLFANKNTAGLYDGYGYDFNGNKNNFANSFMFRKIIIEYGGGNGQPDRIAQTLNVNSGDWAFDESDMPVNLKYNPSFSVGLQNRYCINNRDALILNINASKLTVNGNFTIITRNAQAISGQLTNNIKTFSITGGEQRIMTQLGYQRVLGDNDKLNAFVEFGAIMTMAKFEKNAVQINNLNIDLTTFYNVQGYETYRAKNLTGIGFGVFGGLGLMLTSSPKWTIQVVYNPSIEKINIGNPRKYSIQNTLGLRAYYNL